MTIKKDFDRGFTLIELLVVIAIIATLATVSVPMIQIAQVKARMIRAGADARNVVMALTAHASQNAGLYPEGENSSNEAFRKLFPQAADQESMFYVRSDRMFCDPQQAPDEGGEILAPGECHWAYVNGLTDSHKSNTPVIADGFTDGIGRYDHYHAWHKLHLALVGLLDGSVQHRPINENGDVVDPGGSGNLFEIPAIRDDDLVTVLNPEGRRRASSR